MVDKELIEIWRNMLKPSISSRLLKTNYEGKGEQDKEEFERDFDEILDLALIGLKYKAQLSQEGTTISTCSVVCSTDGTISREDALLCLTGIISDMTIKDYIVMVSKRIRNLPPAQPEERWISVSERLPEEHESMFARFYGSERWNRSMWLRQSDRVIVTSEPADGTRITETARTRDGEWKPDHTILKREIVAWMPMPKPYKGETDETY